jgi:RNA polymerase sigma-70 factor (ECF subfamily)
MATSTRRTRRDRGDHPDHGDQREVTDEELVARFRGGRDPDAFDTLVRRYEQELFGYLRRYLGNAELAEDVFQETFLRVHTKSGGFERGRAFRPWLYAIARDPRPRRPHYPRPLRAPATQGRQLGRAGSWAEVHAAGSQWRRRTHAV